MNKRWLIPFALLALVSLLALFIDPGVNVELVDLDQYDTGDIAWMLTASCLVLLMTPGLAFFYGGMVRYKNLVSTMLQSFIALGVISILWVVVGYSLAFGDSIGGIIGDPRTFFLFDGVMGAASGTIPMALFAVFQLKFAIITPALITGGFAERIRFSSFLLFIVLFSLFIYCPLAHWTWGEGGFLGEWGVLDFAGGTVVHISAGFAALAGALVLGKRKDNGDSHDPTNIPYILLGTGMLWFGWFGFNAGSSLAADSLAVKAFINTNTASAAAMLSWILYDGIKGKKPSAMGACIGAVVGLVAITPAAGFVTIGQSMFIGFIAAIISNLAVQVKTRSKLDDTLDVFPCHGVGGITGMLATGIFAIDGGEKVGLLYGEQPGQFLYYLLALLIVSAFAFGGSYILFKIVDAILPMRVNEDLEDKGLDESQHGEKATDMHVLVKETAAQVN